MTRRTTSITLGETFDQFVRSEVESGEYASASEVIRAGLRLLKERKERHLEAVRLALLEGERSGFVENFSMEEVIAKARQRGSKTK